MKVGERAPLFKLNDQRGVLLGNEEYLGKKNLVVYFYPKDYTLGCTKEAKTFRDFYGQFKALDAEILGISSDSASSHRDFAAACDLPFPLLSDEGGRVRTSFGVAATLGFLPGRATFVMDRDGVVIHAFSSKSQIRRHVEEALEALKWSSGGAEAPQGKQGHASGAG